LHELRQQYQNLPRPGERRQNLVRQAITKEKMQAKHTNRIRRRKQQHQTKPTLEFESDDEEKANEQRHRQHTTPGSPEWLLESSSCAPPRQMIYAARTHSQLSQFISEVRNTKWGRTTRVAA
jgi:hypothetical protein